MSCTKKEPSKREMRQMDLKRLGRNIADRLGDMTQKELADSIGVAADKVSRIVCGRQKPKDKDMRLIALALRCTVDELLEGVE